MNLPPYDFDVDHVATIRSELCITVHEEKTEQNYWNVFRNHLKNNSVKINLHWWLFQI